MQSSDLIETHAYWTNKDLVSEKEMIRCDNIIQMQNFDELIKANIKKTSSKLATNFESSIHNIKD